MNDLEELKVRVAKKAATYMPYTKTSHETRQAMATLSVQPGTMWNAIFEAIFQATIEETGYRP